MQPGRIDILKSFLHVMHQRPVVGEHRTRVCEIVHSERSDVRAEERTDSDGQSERVVKLRQSPLTPALSSGLLA
jgi:hypothetical protein